MRDSQSRPTEGREPDVAQWVITAQTVGSETYRFKTVKTLDGTREEAEVALGEVASTYLPDTLSRAKRRQVFRYADGHSYYVRISGKLSTHKLLFQVAELVWDTDWPEPDPSAAPEPMDQIPPGYQQG